MLIFLFVLGLHVFGVQASVDCSIGSSSCSSCILAGPDCYWCESETEKKCQPYINVELAQLFCPGRWTHRQCSDTASKNTDNTSKLDKMLELLHELKSSQKEKSSSSDEKDAQSLPDVIKSRNDLASSDKREGPASNADLKDLLHKLILLKLLRKVKNEGISSLSKEDKLLFNQYTQQNILPATKASATVANVNNEVSQLLQLLDSKDRKPSKLITVKSTRSTFVKPVVVTTNAVAATNKKSKLKTLENHVEAVSIYYNEKEEETLDTIGHKRNTTTKNVGHPRNTTTQKSKKLNHHHYCGLYEGTAICNKDNNCTWCNTLTKCMQRSDESYDACVHSKDYDVDACFSSKHCKQCVADDKCYWCDVSKSCHTYPFFGYVPQSCGGDWFVKQCDVQLAVIIIVLPLIMILLALVTFYFCLKYCYYKRKVLRVPLFERPGVFDYRKDKKVYFVHPDDESSENEMEAEKFRKKYRLPIEREPLIDPNS